MRDRSAAAAAWPRRSLHPASIDRSEIIMRRLRGDGAGAALLQRRRCRPITENPFTGGGGVAGQQRRPAASCSIDRDHAALPFGSLAVLTSGRVPTRPDPTRGPELPPPNTECDLRWRERKLKNSAETKTKHQEYYKSAHTSKIQLVT